MNLKVEVFPFLKAKTSALYFSIIRLTFQNTILKNPLDESKLASMQNIQYFDGQLHRHAIVSLTDHIAWADNFWIQGSPA